MNKAVVPISGGIDSTVLLYHAVKCGKFDEVHAISFNYGQRHSKEIDYAKTTTKLLGVNHKIIDLSFFKNINSSSLTNPEIEFNSGMMIYVEDRSPITRATDQTENVKLIVEF